MSTSLTRLSLFCDDALLLPLFLPPILTPFYPVAPVPPQLCLSNSIQLEHSTCIIIITRMEEIAYKDHIYLTWLC